MVAEAERNIVTRRTSQTFVLASFAATCLAAPAYSACKTFENALEEISWLTDEFPATVSVLYPSIEAYEEEPAIRIAQIMLASQELTETGQNTPVLAAALHLMMLETLLWDAEEPARSIYLGLGGSLVEEYGLPDMEASEIFRCSLLCEEDGLSECVTAKGGP